LSDFLRTKAKPFFLTCRAKLSGMHGKEFDVAIVGGGPGGATTGALIKKYAPDLSVAIIERESFPRDHVGESLLPPVSDVLHEMGCWDKIEAANFPIKIGATYRWGKQPELWDFDFLAGNPFREEPRPGKFAGQRLRTAWQVDRAEYDHILLNHARELGCTVLQPKKVGMVHGADDQVESLELEGGERLRSKYYVDASGHSGILRRAMGVQTESPTTLQNVAIWDYFQNAEWAVNIGVGGTRIYVISLQYGWLWFIPVSPTRTSLGLVVPAEFMKSCGMRPSELYEKALGDDPLISGLLKSAKSEGKLQTTKDWSFVAERIAGKNWFLVGESAGFADPILSAGLTMTHLGAKEAAYILIALVKGEHDPSWLREQFDRRQKDRIVTHIRFADYWYTANSQFQDLKEFTAQLAKDVGLDLSPDKAWAWLAQGGFISEEFLIGVGGYSLDFVKDSANFLADLDSTSPLATNNLFRLNLDGAELKEVAVYRAGKIRKRQAYVRGGRTLPVAGPTRILLEALPNGPDIFRILASLRAMAQENGQDSRFMRSMSNVPEVIEAMVHDGWIDASFDPEIGLAPPAKGRSLLKWNDDTVAIHA
jgi:flavin-dependent dehydrogenase